MYCAAVNGDVRVESASVEDLGELVELLHDLFSTESDFQPDSERQIRGLRLILEEPSRGRIFVLRAGGRIFGMINLLITISTAEGGFVLLLEDLVVRPEHRGFGYGSMLVQHALQYAREKGFLRITLLTDSGESRARGFYSKHGFVESGMVPMRHYLQS